MSAHRAAPVSPAGRGCRAGRCRGGGRARRRWPRGTRPRHDPIPVARVTGPSCRRSPAIPQGVHRRGHDTHRPGCRLGLTEGAGHRHDAAPGWCSSAGSPGPRSAPCRARTAGDRQPMASVAAHPWGRGAHLGRPSKDALRADRAHGHASSSRRLRTPAQHGGAVVGRGLEGRLSNDDSVDRG